LSKKIIPYHHKKEKQKYNRIKSLDISGALLAHPQGKTQLKSVRAQRSAYLLSEYKSDEQRRSLTAALNAQRSTEKANSSKSFSTTLSHDETNKPTTKTHKAPALVAIPLVNSERRDERTIRCAWLVVEPKQPKLTN
jgi:hypothetical protein